MASQYLNKLTGDQRTALIARLFETQNGRCFICDSEIDLKLHEGALDVDHVEPLKVGGADDETNFALTHSSCNRSKQASDLRVARVLARFDRIRQKAAAEGSGPNLSDVLEHYGGAKHDLSFQREDGQIRYTLAEGSDVTVKTVPMYEDKLSGLRYFFTVLPIAYLHHDDRIHPRNVGGSLAGLVEEFHRGFPQLHSSLAWIEGAEGKSAVRVFDGQHKATAQVLLGVKDLPVRIFVDPDPDVLLTANTHAGTTLRQVAFDKSVQRRLGSALFQDRLVRFRKERNLPDDDLSFSERDLIQHFKGESREMRRYILDSVRDAITHAEDNLLKDYVEFAGKGQEKPLSYSTIEKTFYSFFIYPDVLETSLDYRADEGLSPRELEISQIIRLMNIVAREIYIGQFDLVSGTHRLENRVQKGEDIPEPHLRAYRLGKEEILYVWLSYVRQIVQTHFAMMGTPVDERRLFQYSFPQPLWDNLEAYFANLKRLPLWVNRELSATIFGGKQTYDFWRAVFSTGRTPQGQQVLSQPINLMEMIKQPESATALVAVAN